MATFPQRLRELRLEHRLTQLDLASMAKVGRSTIAMYESGVREPNLETIELFADYFNVDLEYLLGKSDVPNKYSDLIQSMVVNKNSPEVANAKIKEYKKIIDTSSPQDLRMLKDYKKLDDVDKAEIRGEIRGMLKAEKYNSNKEEGDILADIMASQQGTAQIAAYGGDGVQTIKEISDEDMAKLTGKKLP